MTEPWSFSPVEKNDPFLRGRQALAETKKLMMSVVARMRLLYDASRPGRTSFARSVSPEVVDVPVTHEAVRRL